MKGHYQSVGTDAIIATDNASLATSFFGCLNSTATDHIRYVSEISNNDNILVIFITPDCLQRIREDMNCATFLPLWICGLDGSKHQQEITVVGMYDWNW